MATMTCTVINGSAHHFRRGGPHGRHRESKPCSLAPQREEHSTILATRHLHCVWDLFFWRTRTCVAPSTTEASFSSSAVTVNTVLHIPVTMLNSHFVCQDSSAEGHSAHWLKGSWGQIPSTFPLGCLRLVLLLHSSLSRMVLPYANITTTNTFILVRNNGNLIYDIYTRISQLSGIRCQTHHLWCFKV